MLFETPSEKVRTSVDVSVIIVSYNSRSVLEPCLDSLKSQRMFDRTEVIVVDNASADGTPDMVREKHPWVTLHAGNQNVGFSRGVNFGIRAATGKYFLILNPDTVVRQDSIEKLFDFMEQTPDAGVVGPKLVFHDGNLQYSCRRFYNWRVLLLRRTFLGKIFPNSKAVSDHLMLEFDHDSTQPVDWLLGAAMMVRREAVESVGLMDERFFLYFEDVDWCYRMNQKGWQVYYHPDAVVVHDYARDSAQSVLNRSFIAHLSSLVRYYEKWNFVLYFMKKYREVVKTLVFVGVDLIAFNIAFLSAYYLRVILDGVFTNPIFPIAAYERFVVFENLLFVFTFFAAGLYKIRRETQPVDELFSVTRAILLASVLLMTSTYLGQIRTYSRMVVVFLAGFAVIYDWALRTVVRDIHRKLLTQKIDLKRVCLVGPVQQARELEMRLLDDAKLGIEVVGVVDPQGESAIDSLGTLDELPAIVDEYRVQELIFLPGAVSDERIAEFVTMGRRRMLDMTVLTDYSGLVIHQAKVRNLAGRPVIAYERDTRFVVDRVAKRLLDLAFSPCLWTGFSAVLRVILYICRGSRPQTFLTRGASSGAAVEYSVSPLQAPGAQTVPQILSTCPFFWLVIRGKMSMVGPYPVPASETALVESTARFRFDVRPGVTGFWRAGGSSEVPLEDILAQDANYTRNWSFVQDLKILVMTIRNVLLGRRRRLTFKHLG